MQKLALDLADQMGVTKELFTSELAGKRITQLRNQVGQKMNNVLAFAFSTVERYNRTSAFLGGFRTFKKQGMSPEEAFSAAKAFVNDTHFLYGKFDRPVGARGRKGALFTFRLFPINYAVWMKNRVRKGEYKALTKSIGMLMLLAGTTGLPLMDFEEKEVRKGVDEAAKTLLGEDYPKSRQFLQRAVSRGLPAAVIGVDFSGSLGIPQMIPGLETDVSRRQWAEVLLDIVGVLGDIPRRAIKVSRDIKTLVKTGGDWWTAGRLVEDLAPEFLRNPLASLRMYRHGLYTRGGTLIRDTKGQPQTLTKNEAIRKAFGFQPIIASEKYKISELTRNKDWKRNALKSAYLDGIMAALNQKQYGLAADIMQDVRDHNIEQGQSAIEDHVYITSQDVINRMLHMDRMQSRNYRNELEKLFFPEEG